MNIKEALTQMDGLDDSQWTQEGLPTTEHVSEVVGKKVSRSEITEAAPKFTRTNMVIDGVDDAKVQQEQAETTEEVVSTKILEAYLAEEPMLPEVFIPKILNEVPTQHLETLETYLIEQQIAIAAQQKVVEEMYRRVKMNLAFTRSRIKTLIPDMSNQEAIRAYIDNSQAQRAAKSQKIQEVLGGLKPSDIAKLDPRAAIDKAFARKTGRGGQRPVR